MGPYSRKKSNVLLLYTQQGTVSFHPGPSIFPALVSVYSVGLCALLTDFPGCHTNYHNNYSVCNGIHTYCPEKPIYIQVGEHQFVEEKVVTLWTGQMLLRWCVA